jgi:hypothetical protein
VQTVIHVFCRRGRSLRERVARDGRLAKYGLEVIREKQPGRSPGWMKLRSTRGAAPGVVNIEWDKDLNLLTCRIVTKLGNKPKRLVGDLVAYFLGAHWSRAEALSIALRR